MTPTPPDPFSACWAELGPKEGGYSDDPNDSGGETNHGITARVARRAGYMGAMRDLTPGAAKLIGRTEYWDKLKLDQVAPLSYDVARELFDTSFNMGPVIAGLFLQRSLNVFNGQGKFYSDVTTDGQVGSMTVGALKSYLGRRGTEGSMVLMRALNGLQCARYILLAESRAKDEEYVYGWIRARVV